MKVVGARLASVFELPEGILKRLDRFLRRRCAKCNQSDEKHSCFQSSTTHARFLPWLTVCEQRVRDRQQSCKEISQSD